MKILFISYFNGQLDSGGGMCSNRNLKSLKTIYGKENVLLYSISRTPKKKNESKLLWNLKNISVDIFEFGFGGLNTFHKKEIVDIINKLKIATVFIDSSLFGILSKKIKVQFPTINVVTFFHNVEYKFFLQEILKKKNYFLFYRILLAYFSEKMACKYSNKIISLNQRDKNELMSLYKRKPDMIIPISMENSYNKTPSDITNDVKIALFVGSYFFPNVQGIKWFLENVMPKTNIRLIVVGKDMDKLKNEISQEIDNLEIYSSVPNLTEYYEKADFVVLPIFSGGGMKVKTAEALMFGKFLVGTTEAFVGYEISNKVGICCDEEEEMVKIITNLDNSFKYNEPSKELFLEKYSFDSTINKFRIVLN
ncbi:glycosyltransferase family 4 protein [Flavobacterium zhairuonense]|uniref:glycosyltransferase n=1 Tax=Flavobacterium zhairuonense TaxID=2493631 RepID=UPI00104BADEA|nr:glycosyltransferase [Flavobacterium zhairuonense]KAF2510786.1 glycosyltransferase family 4 protein [Flavobacterium zhairuonense]